MNSGTLRGFAGAETGRVRVGGANRPLRPRVNYTGLGVASIDNPAAASTDVAVDGPLGIPTATANGVFVPSAPASNTLMVDGSLFYQKIYIPRATTLIRFNCSVTTAAASSTLRYGIHGHNPAGAPAALITDFGTVSSASNGVKNLVISQSVTPGFYWLAVCAQGGSPTLTFWTPIVAAQDANEQANAIFPATAIWDSTGLWTSGGLPSLPDTPTEIASCPRMVLRTTG